jgi:hypothetical protein
MSEGQFYLVAFGLLAATFIGLGIARKLRERHEETYSDTTGGWTIRSQLPIDPGHPYNLFMNWTAMVFDVHEGRDEGFDVSYFDYYGRNRIIGSGAIVQLPVEGLTFAMSEGDAMPTGVGPHTADVLEYLAGVSIRTAPYALCVTSITAPRDTVQRTALRLAKAIVADAGGPEAHRPRPGRLF